MAEAMRLEFAAIGFALLGACSRTGLLVPDAHGDAAIGDDVITADGFGGGSCDDPHSPLLAAPRPVAPMSTSFATSQRPTLRWVLAPGTEGACVEICRDRACTVPLERRAVLGTSMRIGRSLPAGVAFWRLRSRSHTDAGTRFSPTWQFSVGSRSAPVETSWGSRLDLNGDGLGDIAASATEYGGRAGRVYVFFGSRSGIATAPSMLLDAPDGPQSNFGSSVGSAGDVDGDGFGDLIVAARGVNANEGRAYVWFGGPGQTAGARMATLAPPAGVTGYGVAANGIGDIDADGFGDLAIGQDPGQMLRKQIFVYRGGANGPEATASSSLHGMGDEWEGFVAAHTAGDVNGDGFGDVVVPAGNFNPERGMVYVYLGSATGLTFANAIGQTSSLRGYYGRGGCAGDVNGDGYTDILAGAEGTSAYSGYVELYLGGASGVRHAASASFGDTGEPYGFLTGEASTLGDVNADGFDDFAVGAAVGNDEHGRLRVFYGSARGPSMASVTTLDGDPTIIGHFGEDFTGANDVDGDGFADTAVGALSGGAFAGVLSVFNGSATGFRTTPDRTIANPSGTADEFGYALAFLARSRTPRIL